MCGLGFGFDVSVCVEVEVIFEELCVRGVSNSYKESLDGYFFLCVRGFVVDGDGLEFAFVVYLFCFCFPVDGDVGFAFDALLHDVACSHLITTDDNVDFFAEVGKVKGFFCGTVSSSDDGDGLVAIEVAVAGCACGYTSSV